jgi:hypothetical protein
MLQVSSCCQALMLLHVQKSQIIICKCMQIISDQCAVGSKLIQAKMMPTPLVCCAIICNAVFTGTSPTSALSMQQQKQQRQEQIVRISGVNYSAVLHRCITGVFGERSRALGNRYPACLGMPQL